MIEVVVRGAEGPIAVGEITQRDPLQPQANWQVPYAEKVLDAQGERVVWDLWDGPAADSLWQGDVRLVFFFHYLDVFRELATPLGDVALPSPTARPSRLNQVEYREP
jgi:hypothetical protein